MKVGLSIVHRDNTQLVEAGSRQTWGRNSLDSFPQGVQGLMLSTPTVEGPCLSYVNVIQSCSRRENSATEIHLYSCSSNGTSPQVSSIVWYQSIVCDQYAHSLQGNLDMLFKPILSSFIIPDPLMDTLGLAPCQRWSLIAMSKHKIPSQTHEHIYIHSHTVHLKVMLLLTILQTL